jgi:polyketide synthase PksN
MAYARHRNALQKQVVGCGQAFVITWPLWRSGGMGLADEGQTQFYLKSSGQALLETQDGLHLFEQLLVQPDCQHLVLTGQENRLRQFLGLQPASPTLPISPNTDGKPADLYESLLADLSKLIAQQLKVSASELDSHANLADFGFDSLALTEFARLLSRHFGIDVTPAVFFGHSTMTQLANYFLDKHASFLVDFYQVREQQASPPQAAFSKTEKTIPERLATSRLSCTDKTDTRQQDDIAIIGMSGRFPQARNIEAMWEILANGIEAVSDIPVERLARYTTKADINQTSGFIPGVAEFDPLFFEISPAEAEMMDPRQRLLLQEAWNALEDAAYGSTQITKQKIGMFVGVEDGEYQRIIKNNNITANHTGILATRLAYFLNLRGPVMAINTACSSSLVATHQACLSLRQHECDTAIAAGVNLMLFCGWRFVA